MPCRNVLVLGSVGVKISQFCELFEMYLTCDSYEQAANWRSEASAINILRLSIVDVEDSYISQQIISLLSDFQEQRSLNTIIVLRRNENDDISKLQHFIFHQFKPNNILYVYSHDSSEKNNLENGKEEFDYNEDTFNEISKSNWNDSVNFCKNIMKRIEENKSGLKIIIRTEISKKLLINLIDNLSELLIPICICTMAECKIIELIKFRRNVNHRYTNRCSKWIKAEYSHDKNALFVKIKTPQINSHDYFKLGSTGDVAENKNRFEAEIVIKVVATFYLFKKQNRENDYSEDIFSKFLDIEDTGVIFDHFQSTLIQKVKELEEASEAVTNRDVVACLKDLYRIEAKIIPEFIEEIFPDNVCYLHLRHLPGEPGVQNNVFEFCLLREPPEGQSEDKFEIRLKRRLPKFKRVIQRIKDYF